MSKRAMLSVALFIACGLCTLGCSFHARDADAYRKATRELLDTRSPDIKSCYDAELKKDEKASGVVVVKFTVEQETGKVTKVRVDEGATTAPAAIGQCVVSVIDGLVLDPPDAREGEATFRWEFQVRS